MRYIVSIFLVNAFIFLCPVHASGLFHESGLSSLSMTTQYAFSGNDTRGFLLGSTLSWGGILDLDYGVLETQYYGGSSRSSIMGGTLYVLRNTATQPFSFGFGVSYQPNAQHMDIPVLIVNSSGLSMGTGSLDVELLSVGCLASYTLMSKLDYRVLVVGTLNDVFHIQKISGSSFANSSYTEHYWAGSGSLYFINTLTENLKGVVGSTLSYVDGQPLGVGITGTLTYVF
jgi:hypothetical protein